ncbi:MAG: oxygenase MpaB family protein, partial [Myxococcota bacterium]
LFRADPLADAVVRDVPPERLNATLRNRAHAPTSVRALLDSLDAIPHWHDPARIRRGGPLLFRAGVIGGIVLGAKSLVEGYASAAGNKPLVFSGRLTEAPAKRLEETSRFVQAVAQAGGMAPGGDGHAITLRVRLIHARVRMLVEASGDWKTEQWAVPINQHDMLGTIFLFSTVFIDGVRRLGLTVSEEEAEEYYQLWRWVGWLIGVEEALLPTGYAEAQAVAQWIGLTRDEPDDDARQLTHALLLGPLKDARGPVAQRRRDLHFRISSSLCRRLIGDPLADALDLPRSRWVSAVDGLRLGVQTARALSGVDPERSIVRGERYWQRVLGRAPRISVESFLPAARLGGSSH